MILFLTILFILLAAIFKAIADTLQHHFETSVFKNMPYQWWDPNLSWKYVKTFWITGYRIDAWHLANSFMIVSFIAAIVLYQSQYAWWIELIAGGTIFNLTFNLFYSILLRRK